MLAELIPTGDSYVLCNHHNSRDAKRFHDILRYSYRQTAGSVVQSHVVGEEAVIAYFPGDVEIVGVSPGESEVRHLYPHPLPISHSAVQS